MYYSGLKLEAEARKEAEDKAKGVRRFVSKLAEKRRKQRKAAKL